MTNSKKNTQQVSAPDAPAREVAAEWVPITELKPWKDNPRKNDGEPVRKVAESIKRFGFSSPIIARANGEIIAGHTRWKAAQTLKLDRVPVRFLDLDPAEAHLLALADNKLNEFAEWNDAQVASILSDFGLPDAELAGWTSAELDKLASALAGGGLNGGSNDPQDEWAGMPEFVQEDKTAFRSVIVHFKTQDDVDAFAELIQQKLTEKTKIVWFPEAEIETYADKRYAAES